MRVYIRRYLGEDVSGKTLDEMLDRFEEAKLVRDLDVGVMAEAIVRAFEKK
jgi:hypothetical protein